MALLSAPTDNRLKRLKKIAVRHYAPLNASAAERITESTAAAERFNGADERIKRKPVSGAKPRARRCSIRSVPQWCRQNSAIFCRLNPAQSGQVPADDRVPRHRYRDDDLRSATDQRRLPRRRRRHAAWADGHAGHGTALLLHAAAGDRVAPVMPAVSQRQSHHLGQSSPSQAAPSCDHTSLILEQISEGTGRFPVECDAPP